MRSRMTPPASTHQVVGPVRDRVPACTLGACRTPTSTPQWLLPGSASRSGSTPTSRASAAGLLEAERQGWPPLPGADLSYVTAGLDVPDPTRPAPAARRQVELSRHRHESAEPQADGRGGALATTTRSRAARRPPGRVSSDVAGRPAAPERLAGHERASAALRKLTPEDGARALRRRHAVRRHARPGPSVPERVVVRGMVVVDRALGRGEPLSGAAPPQRDDLGGDRDRGLLRRAGAEVEADR